MPLVLPFPDKGDDLIERRRVSPARIDAKAERLEACEQLALRSDVESRRAVRPHRQVSLRGRLRIELTHGAGCGVARVREGGLAAFQTLLVGRLE